MDDRGCGQSLGPGIQFRPGGDRERQGSIPTCVSSNGSWPPPPCWVSPNRVSRPWWRRNTFRRSPVRRLELANSLEPEHVPVPGSARVNVPDCQAQMVGCPGHQNYSRRSRVSSTDGRYVATYDVSHDCGEVHRRLEPSHARLVPHRDRLPERPLPAAWSDASSDSGMRARSARPVWTNKTKAARATQVSLREVGRKAMNGWDCTKS